MKAEELRFREFLAAHNLKYTTERRDIFNEIFATEDYFDADELFYRLRSRTKRVSRATVYRTLDLLVKLGLVRRVCMGDKSSHYQKIIQRRRRGHLVCIGCGKIQEFQLPGIEAALDAICKEYHFQPQNRCVQIAGFCLECQGKSTAKLLKDITVTTS